MASEPFKLNGLYEHSSRQPDIIIPERNVGIQGGAIKHQPAYVMPREVFWSTVIDGAVAGIPASDPPLYIATGGGYASNDTLISYLKQKGEIAQTIPSFSGEPFRQLPALKAEYARVREAIRASLDPEVVKAKPEVVEQQLRSFYSDEVNTRMAKEVVLAAIRAGKPVIHESASIYPDTLERAKLAKEHGVQSILIAGDQNLTAAIEKKRGSALPVMTALSHKIFAERFERELVPAFDQIRLYNTDGPEPVLMAYKNGPDQKLEILNPELYTAFINKRHIQAEAYMDSTAAKNPLVAELRQYERALQPVAQSR